MTAVETKAQTEVKKFPLTTLIAMVVGSMVDARTNAKRLPVPALLMTTILIQLALLITLFSADAFSGIAALATGAITI